MSAHFRLSPDSGHIAASHSSATNRLARDEAADGGELRQAAGAVAQAAIPLNLRSALLDTDQQAGLGGTPSPPSRRPA
jgi:hypothetical protein